MPQLTLTYFDMPGRAKVLRRALAMGGIDFTDVQVNRDQFEAIKSTLPYGMVPTLAIEGDVVAESQAIFRYIGRITGMYPPPTEPVAALMVDEVIDTIDDLNERLLIPTYQTDDAEEKKQMRLALVQGPLHKALQLIDRRLQQISQYTFFKEQPSSVFIHELLVWDYAGKFQDGSLDHIPVAFVHEFKNIMATFEKVEKTSRVPAQQSNVQAPAVIVPRAGELTVTSFNHGVDRADATRLALTMGGVPFTDERISTEEFEKRKHTLPHEQLPVIRADGHVCAQSFAMLRYAGLLTGLYPASDPVLAAKIDELVSHIGELYFFFDPIFQDARPSEKESIREALATDVVPESIEALGERLAQLNPSITSDLQRFAIGTATPTTADLAIYRLVELFTSGAIDYIPTTVVNNHERVLAVHRAVSEYKQKKK